MLTRALLSLLSVCLLGIVPRAICQDSFGSTPSPAKKSVRVSFVPPPLDGTISLGIYDAKKLVRILFREADVNEFNVGPDALTATWDGRDDTGRDLPSGKYSAHGVVVGDLTVKTVGFFFNDFVTSSVSSRVRHLRGVRFRDNELDLDVDLLRGEQATLVIDPKQGAILRSLPWENVTHCEEKPVFPNLVNVIDCDAGPNDTLWVIDKTDGSRAEIKQLSRTGELLRRVAIPEGELVPRWLAASATEDRVFLVEEAPDSKLTRLRAISLPEGKTDLTSSDLKTDFEKKVIEHGGFSLENGKPVANNPKKKIPAEKIAVKLEPNPLLGDTRLTLEVGVGFAQNGSFLKMSDGLPLFTISETPDLILVSPFPHGPSTLDVFQDDGAVLEQIRISGLDQMMTFDCGVFELK